MNILLCWVVVCSFLYWLTENNKNNIYIKCWFSVRSYPFGPFLEFELFHFLAFTSLSKGNLQLSWNFQNLFMNESGFELLDFMRSKSDCWAPLFEESHYFWSESWTQENSGHFSKSGYSGHFSRTLISYVNKQVFINNMTGWRILDWHSSLYFSWL